MIVVGIVDEKTGRRLQSLAKQADFEVELKFNKATCTTGCSTTYELLVAESNVEKLVKIANDERQRSLPVDAKDLDYNQMNQVFDPNADEAQCPACGHQFKVANQTECPECGLVLG